MTKTERRLLLAIAMFLRNPHHGRAELEVAVKALLSEKQTGAE